MKKIIYVLTFLLSIISVNVNAEDGFINVRINGNDHYLYGGEINEVEGIRYDSLDNTLILENYKYVSSGDTNIYITNMNDLKIKVVGENTFNECGYAVTDFEVNNTNLNIFGDGTLNLCSGFYSEDEIKIDVKDITINTLNNSSNESERIFFTENADINIKNVKINVNTISSTSSGVDAKNVTFENSSIKGTMGFACLKAKDKLEVISSDVSCYASYYGGGSLLSSGNLHIKDSNISMPKNEELVDGYIYAENNVDIENSNIEANIVIAYNTFSITKSDIDVRALGGREMLNISKDTTININPADEDVLYQREGVIIGKIINNYGKINIKNAMTGLSGTLINNGELIMEDVIIGILGESIKYKDGYIRIDVMEKDKCIEKYGEDKCKHISPLLLTEKPEIPVEKLTGNITEVCPPEEGCYYISGKGEVDFKSEDPFVNFTFDNFIEIGKKDIPKEENNTVIEEIKDVADTIGIINIIFIIIGMLLVSTGIYILIRETKKRKI